MRVVEGVACSGSRVTGFSARGLVISGVRGGVVGQVMLSEAGAEEGASGPVMIGKVIPRELGASEKAEGHEVNRGGGWLGRVRRRLRTVCVMPLVVGGVMVGVGVIGRECGGVGLGDGAGVGSRGTHARDGGVRVSCRGARGGLGVSVVIGLVVSTMGVVGCVAVDVGGLRGAVWFWASLSASSKTCTRLLIVWRTLLMSRLLVGRVDASFKVDPRRWRELEAM
jgi:hypothetical protein